MLPAGHLWRYSSWDRDEDEDIRLYALLFESNASLAREVADLAIAQVPEREDHWRSGRELRFQRFHDLLASAANPATTPRDGPTGRFLQISAPARAALLLVGAFGFDSTEASVVLRITTRQVKSLLLQAYAEIDRTNPLTILHLEPEPSWHGFVQKALPTHKVDFVQSGAACRAAFESGSYDLIIAEPCTHEEDEEPLDLANNILRTGIPTLIITAWPEKLLGLTKEHPLFIVWKPMEGSEHLRALVRQVAFWRSYEEAFDPPIGCNFCLPVEEDAAPQFVPEFQSQPIPRKLPAPFDWVRRNSEGQHIFVKREQSHEKDARFLDMRDRENFEATQVLVNEIIATGREEIILAALASMEHDVWSHALAAWYDDTNTDHRRHGRFLTLFEQLRDAYYAISAGEREVRERGRSFVANCIKLVAADPRALRGLEWRDLEFLVAEAYSKLGFRALVTAGAGDGGSDVRLEYLDGPVRRAIFIELKHWRSGKRVGKEIVAEFAVSSTRHTQAVGMIISTSGFARNATDGLTDLQRRKLYLGDASYLSQICGLATRAMAGEWTQPDDLATLLPESLPID